MELTETFLDTLTTAQLACLRRGLLYDERPETAMAFCYVCAALSRKAAKGDAGAAKLVGA